MSSHSVEQSEQAETLNAQSMLRVHDLIERSRANGPGTRAVLWLQGCSLACPGCFNPETHSFSDGRLGSPEDVFLEISAIKNIEGLTISGGEPLQQFAALLELLRLIRSRTGLSVILFTGFAVDEIEGMPGASELLSLLDVLIAGRYQQNKRVARHLIGSSNKSTLFLTERYSLADLQETPCAEVIIRADGTIVLSGIDPIREAEQ